MSTIIKTQTNLELLYRIEKNKQRFWSLLIIIFFFIIIPTKGISLIPLIICGILKAKHIKQVNIFRSGLNGEKLALKLFKQLPDDYTILSDINICMDGKRNQIDYIILGPNGIFVVEVKNHNGNIAGDITDNRWNQLKQGKNGISHKNYLNNPVKQVNRQVYYLSQFLKQNCINTWVQGVVFFSNEEATGRFIPHSKVPIFMMNRKKGKDLLRYITHNKNRRLNTFQKRKIINLLR